MDSSLKKKILLSLAAAAGILLLVALGWLFAFKLQFRLYQDYTYKFSIKYPRSWKIIIHPHNDVAVVFLRPQDTAMDTVRENFNVTVQPLPNGITSIDEFSATVKAQMTGVFGKSIIVSEDKPMRWGWRKGRQMVFDAPKPDHLKMINAWVFRETQAYILTFFGDMNKYKKDAPVVNEMIRSLRLQ